MQKWEYKIVPNPKEVGPALFEAANAELNDLGAQGWELVALTCTETGKPQVFYFKRPKS